MKKTIAWILVLALLAVASVLGTIAYLKDEATADNVMTVGNVKISLLEFERTDVETPNATNSAVVQEFSNKEKPLLPAVIEKGFDYIPGDTYVDWTQNAVKWQQQNDDDGYTSPIWDPAKINNEVDKMVFVKNTGDYGAYVRLYFAFEAGNFETLEEFQKMIHLNLNETGDWEWEWIPNLTTNGQGGNYFIANATYKKELLPGDFTDITLSQIALDPTATNEQVEAFGDTYEVFVNAQGIQSAGFKDPDTALDEGFGTKLPFENFVIKGANLYNALHYLNGDKAGTKITKKITGITFGITNEHSAKVEGFEGIYVSEEQDVPVYAYYVPNATDNTKYDIYVLADDKIYTPKDSTELFYGMSSLKKVDTSNLDVSKTESMLDLFNGCSKLSDIDVSGWDVSKVTSLNGVFFMCSSLTKLDLSSWDVSKVTDFFAMFCGCTGMTELNLSGWNLRSAEETNLMFEGCTNLNKLYLHDWNVSTITRMQSMFKECESLTTLDLSGWNTVSLKDTLDMFDSCSSLETIFVGDGWDVSSVIPTQSNGMFRYCTNLVGGAGTEYAAANLNDKTYAHVDGGEENPGYLTLLPAGSANP